MGLARRRRTSQRSASTSSTTRSHRPDILAHAYALSKSKKGAAGVDGVTFEWIEASGEEEWLASLGKELHGKTYEPSAVRSGDDSQDPGGGERPLGIPTIRDRVVQTAVALVIGPIFEADLEPNAHGYRPGHSATGAVEKVKEALNAGMTEVVDADLSRYSDAIPHDQLMQSLARRISDGQMLALIKAWLKVPVEERDNQDRPRMSGGKDATCGVPQGGPLSPLLANVCINRLLKAFARVAARYDAALVELTTTS